MLSQIQKSESPEVGQLYYFARDGCVQHCEECYTYWSVGQRLHFDKLMLLAGRTYLQFAGWFCMDRDYGDR